MNVLFFKHELLSLIIRFPYEPEALTSYCREITGPRRSNILVKVFWQKNYLFDEIFRIRRHTSVEIIIIKKFEQFISGKHMFNSKRAYNQLDNLTIVYKSKYVVIKCIMLTCDVFKFAGNHICRKIIINKSRKGTFKKYVRSRFPCFDKVHIIYNQWISNHFFAENAQRK